MDDEWFETETTPDLIINVDGNFDAVLDPQMKIELVQFGMLGKHNGQALFQI